MQNVKNGHYDLERTRNNLPDDDEPPTRGNFNFEELSTKTVFIETRIINFRNYRNFKRVI